VLFSPTTIFESPKHGIVNDSLSRQLEMAQPVTLLPYILEKPCSNLGHSDFTFPWFPSVPSGEFWDNTLKYAMTVSFHILAHPSFIKPIWGTESVVK
jgi:hypothetical protein